MESKIDLNLWFISLFEPVLLHLTQSSRLHQGWVRITESTLKLIATTTMATLIFAASVIAFKSLVLLTELLSTAWIHCGQERALLQIRLAVKAVMGTWRSKCYTRACSSAPAWAALQTSVVLCLELAVFYQRVFKVFINWSDCLDLMTGPTQHYYCSN